MMILAALAALAVLLAAYIVPAVRRQDFRYRDVLLFAVAFTIPLRGLAVMTFAGGHVRLGDIFLLLAIEAAALEWLIADRRVRLTRIDVLLIALILWCFCTLAWSLDRSFGVTRSITYTRDLLLYGVFAYWSRERFLPAFRAVSAGVVGSFAYLYFNLALRLAGSDIASDVASGDAFDLMQFRGGGGMGGLTFSDGSVLDVSLWATVAILLWLGFGGWMSLRRAGRVFFVVVMCAMVAIEIVTFSRGGWLGLAAGIACWVIWIGPELRRKLLVYAVVLLAAGVLLTYQLNLTRVVTKRFEMFIATKGDKAVDERVEYWLKSFQALEHHPMGVGIGGTNVLFEHRGVWLVHNLYIQFLTELGPIGLGLLLGILALVLERTIRAARVLADRWTRIAAASLAAAIVAYLVTGTTNFDLSDLVIWLVLALASAAPRHG